MIIDPGNLFLDVIIRHIHLAGKSVLEVGYGDGRLSSQLSCHTGRLTAVGPEGVALDKARGRLSGITFALASGESLAFAAHCFDAVVFTLSLHHQNSIAALREATRVVHPDGIILMVEPCQDGEVELLCNVFNDETEVLNQAMQAVSSSGLSPGQHEILTPQWKCADGMRS